MSNCDCCIIVPSHVSSHQRVESLIDCLKSLISQSIPTKIFLSVSFENDSVRESFRESLKNNHLDRHLFLEIVSRERKTAQFRLPF
jgi:hypothetical protein